MSDYGSRDRSERNDSSVFRAKVVVEPDPAVGCAVLDSTTDAAVVGQQLKSKQSCSDSCECHVELSGTPNAYVRTEASPSCLCPVLKTQPCVARIEAVRAGALVVTLTVRSRRELSDTLDALTEAADSVSMVWLAGPDSDTLELDAETITDNQRETLETALEVGYYDDPSVSLSELAAELGRSESAVSQRLNTAEMRLVRSVLDQTVSSGAFSGW
jgi:pyrimidine deaminase RibD-like protein